MKLTKRKKIGFTLLFIGVLIISLALSQYYKPHIDVYNTNPDIITNATDLLYEFENDEEVANRKFLDKIIQVNGQISKVEASENNDIILTLKNQKDGLGTVICNLSTKENKKLINLKEGQIVSVKGICTGYLMDVILVRCNVVNN
ncbi:OB-fold protein [Tenacibaculum discolor]|uniref:OB-fold protein n=1 Tax=Tenacibaculum discolor TaxID=361581 RepID=UPI003F7B2B76